MTLRKKRIAGIVAVTVAGIYALTRWRGHSEDRDEQAHSTANQTPVDDDLSTSQ